MHSLSLEWVLLLTASQTAWMELKFDSFFHSCCILAAEVTGRKIFLTSV